MDKKFASRIEVASILGIDRRTFSGYCTGRRQITNVDMRKKLFGLTGIETFKSDTLDTQDSVLLTIWADLYVETPSNRKNDDKHDDKDDSVAQNDHETVVKDSKASVECIEIPVDGHKCDTVATRKKEDLKVLTTGKNDLGGVDRPFLDIATDLRNWFNNQHIWKTQKEIAEHMGISHSGIKKVFQGVKKPEGIIKQKLYDMTQLECFRDDKQEKSAHIEEKNVCTDEDNVHIDDTNVCVDKIGIHIYEVETSIDKKNGHTKKMKIPIHEVKTRIIEIKEPIKEIKEPVNDVQESVSKIVGSDV